MLVHHGVVYRAVAQAPCFVMRYLQLLTVEAVL
jgi:hypothetical protein